MTPEEYAKQALFADGRFLAGDEMGKTIEKVIKLALAERTEQCAKICDEYWRIGPAYSEKIDEIVGKRATQLAKRIRALNQENKS